MRSVRFGPELDERVQQAAARAGVSVSEFIRVAAASRADEVLGRRTVAEAWADYIGSVDIGETDDGESTDIARRHSEVFGEIVTAKHDRRRRDRRAG